MTDDLPLSGVKVGDKLCVLQRMGSKRIVVVERVTPSGRVITPAGEFNPNGTVRGQADPWNRMTARPANKDDIERASIAPDWSTSCRASLGTNSVPTISRRSM